MGLGANDHTSSPKLNSHTRSHPMGLDPVCACVMGEDS